MPRGRHVVPLALTALLAVGACEPVADPAGAAAPTTATRVTPPTSPTSPASPASPASATPVPQAPRPAAAPRQAARSTPPTAARGTALAALASLRVKGRAAKTGYEREVFGHAWADVDRNGCDTRNDILRRDLTAYVVKAGTRGCLVLRGSLRDPYTGTTIGFVRGASTSARVQIDHVVALSDAWQKGAQQLSFARRTAFANDPLNLLAVDGPSNQRKGDGDAATWLPPQRGFRCAYVARQVAVKSRYGLWVTAAERDAMARVLQTCPSHRLPSAGVVPLGGGRVEAGPPTPSPRTTPAPHPGQTPAQEATDPRFDTCTKAKAAGYGPYLSGQDPEYGWYRDRDGDGRVCE
jgi:hypothetical protein